ncbi:putative Ty3/Gypsy polyprotein/retrotransposon [Trifolium medium]|uniref:Putative Ty3/Gypsy polyprotein/retrotransposon n=1 Tax=Trifolium medium TaxID=97028 RepID=A0A392TZB9_9FABA|nr:putative Ty3/Gypsy polyprotein/retrotransposon [Trifolium medium]
MNNKPPIFKGGYDPDGAQTWLEGIERIFGAMRCLEVMFSTIKLIIGGEMQIRGWELMVQRLLGLVLRGNF